MSFLSIPQTHEICQVVDCFCHSVCLFILLYIYASTSIYESNALTLLHSERPKLFTMLAFLSAIGLNLLYGSNLGVGTG